MYIKKHIETYKLDIENSKWRFELQIQLIFFLRNSSDENDNPNSAFDIQDSEQASKTQPENNDWSTNHSIRSF